MAPPAHRCRLPRGVRPPPRPRCRPSLARANWAPCRPRAAVGAAPSLALTANGLAPLRRRRRLRSCLPQLGHALVFSRLPPVPVRHRSGTATATAGVGASAGAGPHPALCIVLVALRCTFCGGRLRTLERPTLRLRCFGVVVVVQPPPSSTDSPALGDLELSAVALFGAHARRDPEKSLKDLVWRRMLDGAAAAHRRGYSLRSWRLCGRWPWPAISSSLRMKSFSPAHPDGSTRPWA